MKVLMGADTLGGVFIYAAELVAALRARDVEVSLATFGRPMSDGQRAMLQAARVSSWHESTLRLEWMADPWRDLGAAQQWLLDLEQREAPDLIHLNSYAHGAAQFSAPVVLAGHSCVLSWWQAVHGVAAPPQWDRYRRAVRAGIARADAVVAPSEWMLAQLRRYYGPLPPASRTIVNGISPSAVPTIDPEVPLVLAAGRMWDAAKNLQAIVRAAGVMRARGEIAVAGELGGATPRAGGTTVWIRVLGQLDPQQLKGWRARATVFAAPARYEPFGLAILEAARDRCALVLGDIASLRELWDDCAVYVPPEDPQALASALDALLEKPARAMALAAAAHKHSLRYTTVAMADRYLSLYRELINARGAIAA